MTVSTTNNFKLGTLTKRSEFLFVRDGLYAAKGGVVVQMRANPARGDKICIGFTATKKIGNAVTRNRAKRRLREAARAKLPTLGLAGYDYVFIARDQTPQRSWNALLDDVVKALITLSRRVERKNADPKNTDKD